MGGGGGVDGGDRREGGVEIGRGIGESLLACGVSNRNLGVV